MQRKQQSKQTIITITGTLCSRIVGFIRDSLLAYMLGASADIFLAAFRLPNLVRRLCSEGTLGMAHVSFVSRFFSLHGWQARGSDNQKGVFFSCQVAVQAFLWVCLLSVFLGFLATPIMTLITPGFTNQVLEQAIRYFRLCLAYLPMAVAGAIVAATLNAAGRFAASSFSPVFLNIGIITLPCLAALTSGSVSFLSTDLALFFCFGLVFGGCLQLIFLVINMIRLLPKKQETSANSTLFTKQEEQTGVIYSNHHSRHDDVARHGEPDGHETLTSKGEPPRYADLARHEASARYPLSYKEKTPPPHHVLIAMVRTIPGGITQQAIMLIAYIAASFLASGSISAIYFAERLIELPLAVAGVAIANVALPTLSTLAQTVRRKEFQLELGHSTLLILFLSLPAAAGLAGIAFPLTSLLFEQGNFGQQEVMITAKVLRILCLGIPGMCVSRIFIAAIAALDVSKSQQKNTAFLSLLVSAFVTALGCVMLLDAFNIFGISVAIVCGIWSQVLFLWGALYKKKKMPLCNAMGIVRIITYILCAWLLFIILDLSLSPAQGKIAIAFMLLGVIVFCCTLWFGLFSLFTKGEAYFFLHTLLQRSAKKHHTNSPSKTISS